MAKASKRPTKREHASVGKGNVVSEPQAVYARKLPRPGTPKRPNVMPGRRGKKAAPGVIDVDRFFGTMPHLKGDAVKVQRQMRDEW